MKTALKYNETLKEKFEDYPQIKRIARHRHVPYRLFKQQIELKTIMKSQARKYVKYICTFDKIQKFDKVVLC